MEIRLWFITMHKTRHNISEVRYVTTTPTADSYWAVGGTQEPCWTCVWTRSKPWVVNTGVGRKLQRNCDCMQRGVCTSFCRHLNPCKCLCLNQGWPNDLTGGATMEQPQGWMECFGFVACAEGPLIDCVLVVFPGTFLRCSGARVATCRRRSTGNWDAWARLTPAEWGSTCPCRMEPLPPLTFLSPSETIKQEVIAALHMSWHSN